MLESVFNKVAEASSEMLLNQGLHHEYFSKNCKIFVLIFRNHWIQTFLNKFRLTRSLMLARYG